MTTRGTKVNEPHSIIQESPGPITTDSLAAESTRAGGVFGQNTNSEPQGVAGSNSTFTTTNTSGATRLDPASDAETRMAQTDWEEERRLSSGFSASDAPGRAAINTQSSRETDESREGAAKNHGWGERPKGRNLHEGGFESDDRINASFNSDIGSKNDPGRRAEDTFEARNAGGGVGPPRQRKISGDTPYGNLDNETSA